ncbi:MAG: Gx transporter family protein [Candidatus Firestonebacteria bacterium]|nr:Gx transporter family protein [Candidatus Firestonebacteria bacterium]
MLRAINSKTNKIVLLSLFISIAVVLHIIEASFPYFIFPWAKLGLPNIAILFALIYFGLKEGLYVSFIKTIMGGFITGTIGNPIFIMSISGSIISTIIMWICLPLQNRKFTLVTISIIGALAHITTQFLIVWLFFFSNLNLTNSGMLLAAPYFIIFALPVGFLTGMAANFTISYLNKIIPYSQRN